MKLWKSLQQLQFITRYDENCLAYGNNLTTSLYQKNGLDALPVTAQQPTASAALALFFYRVWQNKVAP